MTELLLIPERQMAYIAMTSSDWPSVQVMKGVQAEVLRLVAAESRR